MKSHLRDLKRMAKNECHSGEIEFIKVDTSHKHWRIYFISKDGLVMFVTCAATPSCKRSLYNIRSDIRRAHREMAA